jgi:hypothetical protein
MRQPTRSAADGVLWTIVDAPSGQMSANAPGDDEPGENAEGCLQLVSGSPPPVCSAERYIARFQSGRKKPKKPMRTTPRAGRSPHGPAAPQRVLLVADDEPARYSEQPIQAKMSSPNVSTKLYAHRRGRR